MKRWIGLLLLLPLLWLAPVLGGLGQIHSAPGAEYSDLAVAHLPNAEFLRQSLSRYGEIPMWNPYTLGGTPFAADPLSGIYYPPLWLALALPPALAFNILFLLHLAFAGTGAFLLARGERVSNLGAVLAGIAFGGLPKFVAHIAAGHLTLVLAVSWTPWLLLAARKAAREGSIRAWALAGVMAGFVFLVDPRWAIPSALAAVGYALVSAAGSSQPEKFLIRFISWVGNLAVFASFAVAIAAVLALPMAQFVTLSTRATLTGAEATVHSLPFLSLLGLLLGGIGGSVEWVVYPGAVVMLLALASIARPRLHIPSDTGKEGQAAKPGGEGIFWLIVFVIALLLSLGSNIPGLSSLLGAIPSAGLLRVPPRWLFLAGLALAMLAARGLTSLESTTDERGILKKSGFAFAAGGFILAAASVAMALPAALWQDGLIWGAAGAVLFAGFFSKRWAPRASVALVCLAVIDLAITDFHFLDPHPSDLSSPSVQAAASFLEQNAAGYRVYSPSESIPAWISVPGGLRMLDGVNPLILASTEKVVSEAARVPSGGYSVTLPAFATGRPEVDNRNSIPDFPGLGLLNVRYLVSAFEIPSAMPDLRQRAGGIYVYENPTALPRAWMAESLSAWDRPLVAREARVDSESPNRMRLTAEGPGWLLLSEAAYPAWRATVDGQPAEIRTAGGWWRAVEIGPGEHTVQMSYDTSESWIGLAVTALALLACLGAWRWAR
jgi:hypothetical protein